MVGVPDSPPEVWSIVMPDGRPVADQVRVTAGVICESVALGVTGVAAAFGQGSVPR